MQNSIHCLSGGTIRETTASYLTHESSHLLSGSNGWLPPAYQSAPVSYMDRISVAI